MKTSVLLGAVGLLVIGGQSALANGKSMSGGATDSARRLTVAARPLTVPDRSPSPGCIGGGCQCPMKLNLIRATRKSITQVMKDANAQASTGHNHAFDVARALRQAIPNVAQQLKDVDPHLAKSVMKQAARVEAQRVVASDVPELVAYTNVLNWADARLQVMADKIQQQPNSSPSQGCTGGHCPVKLNLIRATRKSITQVVKDANAQASTGHYHVFDEARALRQAAPNIAQQLKDVDPHLAKSVMKQAARVDAHKVAAPDVAELVAYTNVLNWANARLQVMANKIQQKPNSSSGQGCIGGHCPVKLNLIRATRKSIAQVVKDANAQAPTGHYHNFDEALALRQAVPNVAQQLKDVDPQLAKSVMRQFAKVDPQKMGYADQIAAYTNALSRADVKLQVMAEIGQK